MGTYPRVAYFSAEVAIDECLHTYAGGLGVVAGSFLRSAARLGLPVVGVSIYWTEGYYDQSIESANGRSSMRVSSVPRGPERVLKDTGLILEVMVSDTPVKVKAFLLEPHVFGTCPVLFLSTDIPENSDDPLAQLITRNLYGGNEDRKLAQRLVLAAGIEALRRFGYEIDIYHLNESFSTLVGVALLQRELQGGRSFEEALSRIKPRIVFTTHTPEKGGNEMYSIDDMCRMSCFTGISRADVEKLGTEARIFDSTAACLKMAKIANGVSKLHAGIAGKMWHWVPDAASIISITNGVDSDYWQYAEFRNAADPDMLREAKRVYKRKLLRSIGETRNVHLSENIPLVVWARRFAEYKRPFLLFRDSEWTRNLLSENHLQVVLAGKPHPEDSAMIDVWNSLLSLGEELPNLVVLPEYGLELSKILKAGADIWLNTPRRPREACGTSWMSAAMNGALNVSSRDGGMLEGIPPDAGFLFGVDHELETKFDQDAEDFQALQDALTTALTLWRISPQTFYEMALRGKTIAQNEFTSDRMVREYLEKMYNI